MSSIKYTATIAPNTVKNGDKVQIKGILTDDATEFSINFVNELCHNPSFITYHFKWILDEKVIVENYKENGEWINHVEQKYDDIDGKTFELLFTFQDGYIDVYKIYEDTPNRITTYEPELNINQIKSLQIWGDVKKILKITFLYE